MYLIQYAPNESKNKRVTSHIKKEKMTDSLMGATHKIQTIRKKKPFYGKMQDKQYKKERKRKFCVTSDSIFTIFLARFLSLRTVLEHSTYLK